MNISPLQLEPSPVTTWPRVCENKDGSYVIHGRCLGSVRWKVLRQFCYLVIRIVGFVLLAAAFLPSVMGLQQYLFAEGGFTGWMIDQLLAIRWFVRGMLVETYPHLGQAIRYSGQNPNDWHLVGMGVLTLIMSVPLSIALTFLLSVALWPLMSCRIKITITPQNIFVHRWWGRLSLSRIPKTGGKLSFRTVNLASLRPFITRITALLQHKGKNKESNQHTAAVVMHGLRNHIIVCPLITRRADQIISVCHHTLSRSKQLPI